MQDEDDFDFGFSTVNAEELKASEVALSEKVNEKAEKMYNAVMPLLNNLMKDAETNEYIHWPNRKQKIKEFIRKLEIIMKE
jgi:hypothetical protein